MQHVEEQFSALVDDEADVPRDHLVSRLLDDEEARQRWARHHLIGDVLRDHATPLDLGLAARIRAAVDAEPPLLAPTALPRHQTTAPTNARPRRAWALAASLAAVGVTGLLLAGRTPEPAPAGMPVAGLTPSAAVAPVAVRAPAAAQIAAAAPAEPQFVSWDDSGVPSAAEPRNLEFHRRLNSYLVNFNEQRSNLGVPGVHPYVRIVGFEGDDEP